MTFQSGDSLTGVWDGSKQQGKFIFKKENGLNYEQMWENGQLLEEKLMRQTIYKEFVLPAPKTTQPRKVIKLEKPTNRDFMHTTVSPKPPSSMRKFAETTFRPTNIKPSKDMLTP